VTDDQKTSNEVTCRGKLFRTRAAATQKARLLTVDSQMQRSFSDVLWQVMYLLFGGLYRTCMRCLQPLTHFFTSLQNPKFSASMDVYAPMFFCDLVTFLIVVFGYDKFGPSVSLLILNICFACASCSVAGGVMFLSYLSISAWKQHFADGDTQQ